MPEGETLKAVVKKDKDKSQTKKNAERPKEIDPDLPEEIAEALEEMPARIRRSITMAMMQTSIRGSAAHPLFEKFTPEHIALRK